MTSPAVSVVIPCYNQGHFLDDAVNSVLAQSLPDVEIIVVNDGSTAEESVRICRERSWPRTRIINQENQGRSMARNNGIADAAAPYILCLDADDKIGPDFLRCAVAVLDTEANVGIVYPRVSQFGSKSGEMVMAPFSHRNMLHKHCIVSTSGVFRKIDWEAVGGFDRKAEWMEDLDFWLSLLDLGRDVRKLPEIHFFYRRHGASTTAKAKADQLNRYLEEAAIFPYIIRKHQRLYMEHADILGEKLATKPDLPRFHDFKLRKYETMLSILDACSKLPLFRRRTEQRAEALRKKIERIRASLALYR